jgi:hypothetical protein
MGCVILVIVEYGFGDSNITNQALCIIIGSNGVTYSQSKNIFLSNGYESVAGNVYN